MMNVFKFPKRVPVWILQVWILVTFFGGLLLTLLSWSLTIASEPDTAKILIPTNVTLCLIILILGVARTQAEIQGKAVSILKKFLIYSAETIPRAALFTLFIGAIVVGSLRWGIFSTYSQAISCSNATQLIWKDWRQATRSEACSTNKLIVIGGWSWKGLPAVTCLGPSNQALASRLEGSQLRCPRFKSEVEEALPPHLYGYLIDARTALPVVDARIRIIAENGADVTAGERWLTDSEGYYAITASGSLTRGSKVRVFTDGCADPIDLSLLRAFEITPKSEGYRPLFRHYISCQ